MASILAFAGSNSSTSINFKLVKHTTSIIQGHEIQVVNLANFPFPMYSEDHEKENGYSNSLVEFKNDIQKAAGLIISVNEHNSNPSAYFKNLIDWLSRLERNFLENTPILLMSTSGGKRGASSALEVTRNLLPRFGAKIVDTFSLPSFHVNFDSEKGISDVALAAQHKKVVDNFLNAL
ncbi:MAG: NAD(P)H-dependent oxidoreductase [Flavobacteriaceae bacterium]